MRSVRLQLVASTPAVRLWNYLVSTHHYLHSSRIEGRQLKYVAYDGSRPIACLGWGEAAWELRARDRWIGWTRAQRRRARHRVVGNVRFLILPWVRVPNLASYLLALSVRTLQHDWQRAYASAPVLLESFVDPERFHGTSYLAANWLRVGLTSGYAKKGATHHNSQRPKAVFLYPLDPRCNDRLRGHLS